MTGATRCSPTRSRRGCGTASTSSSATGTSSSCRWPRRQAMIRLGRNAASRATRSTDAHVRLPPLHRRRTAQRAAQGREARLRDGPGVHEEPAAVEVLAAGASATSTSGRAHCKRLKFKQTVSHDSYLINLAATDADVLGEERRAVHRGAAAVRGAGHPVPRHASRRAHGRGRRGGARRRSSRRSTSIHDAVPADGVDRPAWRSTAGQGTFARVQARAPRRDHRAREGAEAAAASASTRPTSSRRATTSAGGSTRSSARSSTRRSACRA